MFFLLCLSLALDNDAWRISDTEVFQPLQKSEVIVRPDGEVYILNFNSAEVRHYDADGKLKGTIGRKGRGPGEFTYPTHFAFDDNRLYIYDAMNGSISWFEPDGKFIDRAPAGREVQELVKVKDGWIYAWWQRDGKAAIYTADNEFGTSTKIMDLSSTAQHSGLDLEMGPAGAVGKYMPVATQPYLHKSLDGSKVFASEPTDFVIHVIDVATRKKVDTIKRKETRIPFDTEWADEQFASIKERIPPQDRNINFKKMYPDYFPTIRNFTVDYKGRMIFNKWMGRPDKNQRNLLALDANGKAVTDELNWNVLSRVVTVLNNHAYVTTIDEDSEEAGLARVPMKALEAFITENPIEFSGTASRSIMIDE